MKDWFAPVFFHLTSFLFLLLSKNLSSAPYFMLISTGSV